MALTVFRSFNFPSFLLFLKKFVPLPPEFRRHSGGVRKDFIEKGVIEIIFN
jgi:hypothetical protein